MIATQPKSAAVHTSSKTTPCHGAEQLFCRDGLSASASCNVGARCSCGEEISLDDSMHACQTVMSCKSACEQAFVTSAMNAFKVNFTCFGATPPYWTACYQCHAKPNTVAGAAATLILPLVFLRVTRNTAMTSMAQKPSSFNKLYAVSFTPYDAKMCCVFRSAELLPSGHTT